MKSKLEWWGGAECTVNRVGNRFHDQLERTGHAWRLDDLERMQALGIERVRFPILWERSWSGRQACCDFTWSDLRMHRLRELDMAPIVGLLHHGSGPLHTHLLDPAFPRAFAGYAGLVAERYPWVTQFTPINEMLTTARFSALYGHWYPHAKDDCSFVRALLTQVRATQLAMRAIRKVIPNAQLISTEDLGTIFSTPVLAYQADFENARRWLSMDLMFGRVGRDHPMYGYLTKVGGATHAELACIADEFEPPDILGINYYVTSDRFLDHRLELYSAALHGGNGRHAYADVEAVRMSGGEIVGHHDTLRAVWERFETPLALSEVHLGCHDQEEQALWLEEAWGAVCRARAGGMDVRAITAWCLFGAFDWSSLVTRWEGKYESGAFDVRIDPPQPTAVADTIRRLAAHATPLPGSPGWWRRAERGLYPTYQEGIDDDALCDAPRPATEQVSGLHPHGAIDRESVVRHMH